MKTQEPTSASQWGFAIIEADAIKVRLEGEQEVLENGPRRPDGYTASAKRAMPDVIWAKDLDAPKDEQVFGMWGCAAAEATMLADRNAQMQLH